MDVDPNAIYSEERDTGTLAERHGALLGQHDLTSCLLFTAWPTDDALGRPRRDVSVGGNADHFADLARGWGVEAYDGPDLGAGGRGLRTTRPFSEGTAVFRERPIVSVALRDDLCLRCCGPCRAANGPVASLSPFCSDVCERETYADCGPNAGAVVERILHHSRELYAEGNAAQAAFHALALARLRYAGDADRKALAMLCGPTDLPLSELAARSVEIPFSDRRALSTDLDAVLFGTDDAEALDALDDGAYRERRTNAASVDIGDVDDDVGRLTMNAHTFGPTGEAVVVGRLLSLANHAPRNPSAELRVAGRNEISLVALRDLARGEEITIDYCPFSATEAHRAAVLRPFLLEHLAHVPLVEDPPIVWDDRGQPVTTVDV